MPRNTLRTFSDDRNCGEVYDVQHVQAWVLTEVLGPKPGRPAPQAASLRAIIQAAMALHAELIAQQRLAALHAGPPPDHAGLVEQEAMRSGAFANATALDMCATAVWARDLEDQNRPVGPDTNWHGWSKAAGGARANGLMSRLADHMSTSDVAGLFEHRNAWAHRLPVVHQTVTLPKIGESSAEEEAAASTGGWGPVSRIVVDGRGIVPCTVGSLDADRSIVIDAYVSAAHLLAGRPI